uniref:Alpha-mannosidase 2x-like n=1 Tax=Kryptolebias marmoratus TaxID=37003 RepID=A0A3Q3EZU4_KRYMA
MVAPSDNQLPKLRPFLPLRSSLPCDIHLLNLRIPSQEVALLLHRKGFDCSSAPSPLPSCSWSVDLEELLAPLRFRSLRRSGLTLLRDHDEPGSAHQQRHVARLRPMEIYAFRVQID